MESDPASHTSSGSSALRASSAGDKAHAALSDNGALIVYEAFIDG
jgi:hypothetical protein